MELASGVSIVSIELIEKRLKQKRNLLKTLFTSAEIKYCESKRHRAEHYAARLAAKEACLKALGHSSDEKFFSQIEVTRKSTGQPALKIPPAFLVHSPWAHAQIHLSMAHERDAAVAFVLFSKSRGTK